MKSTYFPLFALFALVFAMGSSSCNKCTDLRTFVEYDPVYITEEEFAAPIAIEPAREFINTGMLASYENLLLINEMYEGIHVIDNTDPLNPVNLSFIKILNNNSFSIADDVLYANRFGEIVAIDISDLNNMKEIDRTNEIFEDVMQRADDGRIIAYYKRTERIKTVDCSDLDQSWWRMEDNSPLLESTVNAPSVITQNDLVNTSSSFGANSVVSVNSSTTKFTITQGRLYTLNPNRLNIFTLDNQRLQWSSKYDFIMNSNMEAMFPMNEYLFIGGSSEMQVLSLADPDNPQYLSNFTHTRACDPVVANSTNAYVTIRSGSNCGGTLNQFHVLNITDITNPVRMDSELMVNPRGLTVLGKHVFVCDGSAGLVAFDVSNERRVERVGTFDRKSANDVLVISSDHIVVSGSDGVYILNISNPSNMYEVSSVFSK